MNSMANEEIKLNNLKIKLSKRYGLKRIPRNFEVNFKEMDKTMSIKPVRTMSGVAPIAIMSKPIRCRHGACLMCPDYVKEGVAMSYTGKEPASMRAIRNDYSAYLQVMNRLEQYHALRKEVEKIELIIIGGTFPSFDVNYQNEFIKEALQAMNDFSEMFYNKNKFNRKKFMKFFELLGDFSNKERVERIKKELLEHKKETTLEKEQLRNENAKIKNDTLKFINRGHNLNDTKKAIRLLKDAGYKVGFHWMLGLPNTTREEDIEMFKELFSNSSYKPDALKIYPCMVFKNTPLYRIWEKGDFEPVTTEEAASRIVEMKKYIPKYCRVMRVQRDIPTYRREAGVDRTNLRQIIHEKMKKENVKCNCIRCREPMNKEINWDNVKLNRIDYDNCEGKEIFLSFEDSDILLGFLRLRIPDESFRKEIGENTAIVREMHVYGTAVVIGEKGDVQHRGLGKRLLEEAERISLKEFNKNKIVIISGIGVRPYFEKLGYEREGPYMSKFI